MSANRATVTEPQTHWNVPPLFWVGALAVMVLAMLWHGIPVIGRDYPSGPDYGQMRYAVSILQDGTRPINNPYFQLGITDWGQLAGAPLLFAINSGLSDVPVFESLDFIVIFAGIHALGMMALVWRLLGRLDVSVLAGTLTAFSPLPIDMMTWSAYPNVIALSLFPYCMIVLLDYWHKPTRSNLFLTALTICGTVYIHHVSALWLGVTLIAFVLVELFIAPRATLRKAVPLALVGLVIGLPIALQLLALFIGADASGSLLASNRFDGSRVTWEWWSHILTPIALPYLLVGMAGFLKHPRIPADGKRLIVIYGLISLAFIFGWAYGLSFFYLRALFFLGIPFTIGAVGFYLLMRNATLRGLVTLFSVACLAIYSYEWGNQRADFYQIVSPRFVQAMDWLSENSAADDVILIPTFYAFHAPVYLERPLLVGLTPDIIGNPSELTLAADAVAVLRGLTNMDTVLRQRQVRYIVIRATPPDVPDQTRSRLVLDSHPQMRIVFQNADTIIYRVAWEALPDDPTP
ncbi:MAG: hypothetical protein ACFE0Q_19320 [Anaerolineae bacterium]